jgi:hypothetical protein
MHSGFDRRRSRNWRFSFRENCFSPPASMKPNSRCSASARKSAAGSALALVVPTSWEATEVTGVTGLVDQKARSAFSNDLPRGKDLRASTSTSRSDVIADTKGIAAWHYERRIELRRTGSRFKSSTAGGQVLKRGTFLRYENERRQPGGIRQSQRRRLGWEKAGECWRPGLEWTLLVRSGRRLSTLPWGLWQLQAACQVNTRRTTTGPGKAGTGKMKPAGCRRAGAGGARMDGTTGDRERDRGYRGGPCWRERRVSVEGSGMAIDGRFKHRQMFLRQMVDMAVDCWNPSVVTIVANGWHGRRVTEWEWERVE